MNRWTQAAPSNDRVQDSRGVREPPERMEQLVPSRDHATWTSASGLLDRRAVEQGREMLQSGT